MSIKNKFKKFLNIQEVTKNEEVLNEILPKSEYIFKESYIQTGQGYITYVYIYDFKKRQDRYWIRELTELNNVVVSVRTTRIDDTKANKDSDNSADEYSNRGFFARKLSQSREADKKFDEILEFTDRISIGEDPLRYDLKITVYERTLEGLEKKVIKVLNELYKLGIKGTIRLNEIVDDYSSLTHTLPYTTTKSLFSREGETTLSSAVSEGFPFVFIEHIDSRGKLIGTTGTSGNVIFNLFEQDKNRTSYNGLVFGLQGSGKSTFLKKIASMQLAEGDKVRVFEATEGEFNAIGRICDNPSSFRISLDGTDGIVNPFQIYSTRENSIASYQSHKASLVTFFSVATGIVDKSILNEFSSIVHNVYKAKGIVINSDKKSKDNIDIVEGLLENNSFDEEDIEINVANANYNVVDISKLSNSDFPILNDIYTETMKELKIVNANDTNEVNKIRINILYQLSKAIEGLLNDYGNVFNGYSTIDIKNSDYVVFSTIEIDNYEENIKAAIITNVINIIRSEMYENYVQDGKRILDKEKLKDERNHVITIIDEAHKVVSSETKLSLLKEFTTIQREARKYLCSMILAFHNADDLKPNDSETSQELERISKLSQYKFFFRQDSTSLPYVKNLVGNTMTNDMIANLESSPQGVCTMVIQGQKSVSFLVDLGYNQEADLIATGNI